MEILHFSAHASAACTKKGQFYGKFFNYDTWFPLVIQAEMANFYSWRREGLQAFQNDILFFRTEFQGPVSFFFFVTEKEMYLVSRAVGTMPRGGGNFLYQPANHASPSHRKFVCVTSCAPRDFVFESVELVCRCRLRRHLHTRLAMNLCAKMLVSCSSFPLTRVFHFFLLI